MKFTYSCVLAITLASVATVAVRGTFTGTVNDETNNATVADATSVKHAANAFHKTQFPELFQGHYLAAKSSYDQSDPRIQARISRRQLIEKCTLQDTCLKKGFKECDFRGCQDVAELRLNTRVITGTLAGDLRNLTKLSSLCVGLGLR